MVALSCHAWPVLCYPQKRGESKNSVRRYLQDVVGILDAVGVSDAVDHHKRVRVVSLDTVLQLPEKSERRRSIVK